MLSDQGSAPNSPAKSHQDSAPVKTQRMINLSDSDSDSDLENDNGDNSYLAGLNVPERLKNILRYKDIANTNGTPGDEDNSDSDEDEDLFMRPSLSKTPDRTTATTTATTPTITANSTVRLAPIEKPPPRSDRFEQLLALALGDSTDDEDDDDKKSKKKRPNKKSTKGSKTPTKKATSTTKKKKKPTAKKTKKTKANGSDDDETGKDTSSTTDSDASSTPGRKGKSIKKNNSSTAALLEDTDDSDSDDEKRPKQLSRKARLEMERETQRLRRAAHVKLQPRMVRRTLDDLLTKLESDEQNELVTRSATILEAQPQQTTQAHQSPTRVNIYEKYKKELEKLERFNSNMDDDEDDGLIVVNTETRGTRFLKSVLSAMSPEPSSPLGSNNSTKRSRSKAPASPMALRTLNQQLMAKMGQEQQAYRQEGIEKAKALGLYVSPEERAKQHLEREQEAAVLDLEVQQLLYRKAVQQNQRSNNSEDDEEDDDYMPGNDEEGGLVLSGEERDTDHSDDDEDNEPIIRKRRNKFLQKQKNPFLVDDDEEEELSARQRKAPKAPEPANSIATFFVSKSSKMDDDITGSPTTDGPKSLTRLMQRTLIQDDTSDMKLSDTATDDDDDDQTEDDKQEDASEPPSRSTTPVPTKPKERNDYVEEEAEEEDDEYYGLGGPDVAESADLDRFEEDGMLIHDKDNKETVDSAQIQAEYHKNMLEKDQHMVERLIKDITGGGLRRKRAAAAAGLLLDDYDLYDDDEGDDDLVALRLALANKRKKMMKGDPMNYLASDPKTAAFAKAAMPMAGDLDLSGDEEEDDDKDDGNMPLDQDTHSPGGIVDLDDYSDDDDEEEPIKVNINMVVGDYTEPWTRRSDSPAKA